MRLVQLHKQIEDAQEEGDICILMADSHCSTAETNKTLQSKCPSFKNKLKHKKELQAVKAMEVMGFLTPSEFISLFITRSFFTHHQHGGSEPYSSTPKGLNLGNQRSITQPNYQESFLQTVKESRKLKHEG